MAKSLDIWSVFIIVSIAHSVFTINLLAVKKEFKGLDGKWLLFFLLGLLWLQLEFLAIRWPFDIGLQVFYGARHGSWLLIGPLYYFYIQSITRGQVQRTDLWYLAPFFTFTLIIPLIFGEFLGFGQVHYGMLTPFDQRPEELNFIQYFYSYLFIVQFFYLAYFLYLTRNEISEYAKGLKDNFSSIKTGELQWLKTTWYGVLFILIICTLFIVLLFYFTKLYRRHFDYLYVLPMSLLVYAISYKLAGVKWQQVEKSFESKKYQKSGIEPSEAMKYQKEIEKVLADDKIYLNQDLRLKDLADKLGTPNHTISQVLNQFMDTTFFDLINKYRVMEAKKLIDSNPQYTLLQIAYDSGFNNKTSFVNSFKKFEGRTPSSFLKKSA